MLLYKIEYVDLRKNISIYLQSFVCFSNFVLKFFIIHIFSFFMHKWFFIEVMVEWIMSYFYIVSLKRIFSTQEVLFCFLKFCFEMFCDIHRFPWLGCINDFLLIFLLSQPWKKQLFSFWDCNSFLHSPYPRMKEWSSIIMKNEEEKWSYKKWCIMLQRVLT